MMLFGPEPADRAPPEMLIRPDVETRGTGAAWATFSKCGCYRYMLGRRWDDDGAWLVVCMLNPSTADETKLDPTLRRVQGFAQRDHYGGFLIVNCFAWRATDPRELLQAADPVGPHCDDAIRSAAGSTMMARLVAGWGRPANKSIEQRQQRVALTLCLRRPWHRFGALTKDGHPRHPLYLRGDVPIEKWT